MVIFWVKREKTCLNKGEPSSKLKYELMTDSAKYCEGKVKRTQLKW